MAFGATRIEVSYGRVAHDIYVSEYDVHIVSCCILFGFVIKGIWEYMNSIMFDFKILNIEKVPANIE